MIDLVRKEELPYIKAKVLGTLNMVIGYDIYNKGMMITDLTNLIGTI